MVGLSGQMLGQMEPPPNGDWIISDTVVIEDETIILNGNLTILDGGSLTFHHVTLLMNCTKDGQYTINVTKGGEFYVLDESKISASDSATFNNSHYRFKVYGEMEIDDSEVSYAWGDWKNMPHPGGIQIFSDDVTISNSFIHHNEMRAIDCHNCSPVIVANNISLNKATGIHCYNSFPTIDSNTIYFNEGEGICCDFYSSPTITNNIIYSNYKGILCYDHSCPVIDSNEIFSNDIDGISCEHSSPIITNNTIYSHTLIRAGAAIAIYRSSPIITDNTIFDNILGIRTYMNCLPIIENNTISSSDRYGIFSWYNCRLIIKNSTITNSGWSDLQLFNNCTDTIINSTCKTVTFGDYYHHDENTSVVMVGWFLNVSVFDRYDKPAGNSDVRVYGKGGKKLFDGKTNENGRIDWIPIPEYYISEDWRGRYTPHNITAYKDSYYGWNITNINENKEVIVRLDKLTTPPEIEITRPKRGYLYIFIYIGDIPSII
jgi:parallel beta-helix repeat protein